MSTQATVVVFDLGNVLITWDRRLLYRRIFATEAALERFLEEVYTMEANERFDRGQPLEEFTAELAAAHPEHADAVLALRDRWIETIGPVIDGSVEVLRELLGHGVRCFALSNWNAETFALVEPHHAFLGWFEGVVLSGREWAVLEPLIARPGMVLSRQQLEDKLYGWGDEVSSNAVEVYIHGLRKKLGPELVLNVRGVGYLVPKM